jgi:hypothetical protein
MTIRRLNADQIAELESLLAELPDDAVPEDIERYTDHYVTPKDVLGHLPAVEMAAIKHHYGDAAAMDDEEFARFMASCSLKND